MCVSLQFLNNIDSHYRIISSINDHGYAPKGRLFTLKTVFKDPKAHRSITFHAYDESDPRRPVLLDGARELVAVPLTCNLKPRLVRVTSMQPVIKRLHGLTYRRDNLGRQVYLVRRDQIPLEKVYYVGDTKVTKKSKLQKLGPKFLAKALEKTISNESKQNSSLTAKKQETVDPGNVIGSSTSNF